MTTEIGTTRCASPGAATFSPWIEPRTEIAGVMIPSPKNSAAPKMPSVTSAARVGDLGALKQRGQRHDPAVAAVVRAHDEARVLDRDDDHQRPEDQRNDPVDAGRRGVRGGSMGREDDLLGVQRARADVAVDDAQRAEREHGLAGVGDDVSLGVGQGLEAPANGVSVGFRIRLPVTVRLRAPGVQLMRRLIEGALLARPPKRYVP